MKIATRPRILAVTSELPWPLDSGGHLRTYHLLRSLAAAADLRVIAPVRTLSAGVPDLHRAGINVIPVQASPRSWRREALKAASSALRGEPYVLYGRHREDAVGRAVRQQILINPPDVVYLDHLDSMLFASECGDVPLVCDLHNVYSALLERTAVESFKGPRRGYLARESRLLRVMEGFASRRATVLMATSREDCRYFSGLGAPTVRLVPNGVDCCAYAGLPAGRSGSEPVILYVGTMSWEPNARAAVHLADVVLPEVRKRFPACRLRIVGRDPTPQVAALAARPNVEVTGKVATILPHLAEAHVLAVPLEAGGGTRLKILEAFAAGLPVVSTPVGCEGIEATDEQHLLVRPREAFADAIAEVIESPARSAALAAEGRQLAIDRYDWVAIGLEAARAVEHARQSATVMAAAGSRR
jgi:glycosyltransferase involved in cell wall biosynthesis